MSKDPNCDQRLVVRRIEGWEGHKPGTCRHDRSPLCLQGCSGGQWDHVAHGSENQAWNTATARLDSTWWWSNAVPEELARGVFGGEVGSNDDFYSRARYEAALAARAVVYREKDFKTAQRLTRWMRHVAGFWALLATTAPRRRIKVLSPNRTDSYGPGLEQGPGLRVWSAGMRGKLSAPYLLPDDTGNLLELILDWKPRSSRWGNRPLGYSRFRRGAPWPAMAAAVNGYPFKSGRYRKGHLRHPQHLQAVLAGLADVGQHTAGNAYRFLLRQVVAGELYAGFDLVDELNRRGFKLYQIYRKGEPVENGAHLEIRTYQDGAKAVIWRGPVINGNGDFPVAVSVSYPDGLHILGHPWHHKLPRGSWSVLAGERQVVVTAKDSTQGGRVEVDLPTGPELYRVRLDWNGAKLL